MKYFICDGVGRLIWSFFNSIEILLVTGITATVFLHVEPIWAILGALAALWGAEYLRRLLHFVNAIDVHINDEFIAICGPDSESRIPWDKLHAVIETKTKLYVYSKTHGKASLKKSSMFDRKGLLQELKNRAGLKYVYYDEKTKKQSSEPLF